MITSYFGKGDLRNTYIIRHNTEKSDIILMLTNAEMRQIIRKYEYDTKENEKGGFIL